MNPLLTIGQVATALQISERTVYRLIKTGQITTVKVGSSTRIRESEIDRLLDMPDHDFTD
jgi:excisionase family DNA binding protein